MNLDHNYKALSDAELDNVTGGAPLTWRQAVAADVRNLVKDVFGWAKSIFSF